MSLHKAHDICIFQTLTKVSGTIRSSATGSISTQSARNNTANGSGALESNTTGTGNTARRGR